MKKKIVIAATALLMSAGIVAGMNEMETKAASKTVAINKKNFPDQVFRELVKSNYDKNKDKKLSASEIKKAKKFGTSSCKTSIKIKASKYGKYTKKYVKDIKNFKGIEKLTNLQKFVANETSVKTVNLKKNKNLTYLEMTDGSLEKINLNSNKKLKYVFLEYNKLTSLKMNKCKKLLRVNLTGHMVKKLKIDRNKKTVVIGEEYYAPFSATTVKGSFANLNNGGQIDGDGSYCVYEWAADYSSCVRKTVSGNNMNSQPVALNADAVAKTKSMQKITAQWKDAQGNFYVVADKDGDMVAKTVYYLLKMNPQGGIEAEVNVNELMSKNSSYGSRYTMTLLNQSNGTVVLGIDSGIGDEYEYNNGVIYMDLNTMAVTKQARCNFIPKTAMGDVVAGLDVNGREAIVSKMVNDEMETAVNGNQVQKCQLSSGNRITIPTPFDRYVSPSAITMYDNNIYVISGEGFFKAKLTAKKFTQLYGISKLSGMQDESVEFSLTMKSEKEIYLMSTKEEDDKDTYSLQVGKIG